MWPRILESDVQSRAADSITTAATDWFYKPHQPRSGMLAVALRLHWFCAVTHSC